VLYERVPTALRGPLHHRIGECNEKAYGERAAELAAELAMHFSAARDYPRAVGYLQQATANAARRGALHEAERLAHAGLELLVKVADPRARATLELSLLTTLGPIQIATKGYGTTEVENTYARAHALCSEAGEHPQLFSVLWGLGRFYLVRTPLAVARSIGERLLDLANAAQDPELRLEAHNSLGATLSHMGDFVLARRHLEQAIELYDERQHHEHAFRYGQDPGVVASTRLALVLWFLGYPDRSLACSDQALELARRIDHPFSLAFALSFSALLHELRRDAQAASARADAAIAVSVEHGFPVFLLMAKILRAWARAEQGDTEAAIVDVREALDTAITAGALLFRSLALGVMARACLLAGRSSDGLEALGEALALIDRSGKHFYEAELHRLHCELLAQEARQAGDLNDAGATRAKNCLLRALEVGSQQQAKSWELRTLISLFHLARDAAQRASAREQLAAAYGWFTEGFETPDLREAATILSSGEPRSGTQRSRGRATLKRLAPRLSDQA